MNKAFVYGVSVGGSNFTDRTKESHRLKMNFENGLNVVLISPRRMGKTSLVKHVQEIVDKSLIQTIYIDIFDCRSEYDFYNKFAEALLKQTANKMELAIENIKRFLVRLTPKVAFSPDLTSEYSFSLGITPKEYSPEEILALPELLAKHIGKHIVVCIDEFQQIGEWPDSTYVQKRMRGVWQHQQHVSYCLFGSRQHMMTNIFQNKRMPFYQFGEPNYLQPIPTADWIPFIQSKFAEKDLTISEEYVTKICEIVRNQSSYVQQLAWNVMINTQEEVTEKEIEQGVSDLLAQCTPLFIEQLNPLTTYQMNFLRAINNGQHDQWTSQEVMGKYNLGTKSNIAKMQTLLLEKDFIERREDGLYLSDPVLELWLKQH
ncbi:MAG: ATP-binding protein [Paludibacteraceae bacterium]|nr:ATP-binding protein [Prevotella sp.]MBQ3997801.1 ATP-binding protein [Paludibacteraceae bacterium]